MTRLSLIVILLLWYGSSRATGQAGDILIWKGDTLTLFSNPLELRKDFHNLRTHLFGRQKAGFNTGCWRGYIAEWQIIQKHLYLTNIYSCGYTRDSIKANLSQLFGPECQNNKVLASWVTGELLAPDGQLLYYINNGYASIYEKEWQLIFSNGILTCQKKLDNTNTHLSVFSKNSDSLSKFIYTHIRWQNLPNLMNKRIVVLFTLKSTNTRKPEISFIKKASNDLFNKEASRVIHSIPDWNIFYRKGQLLHLYYMLPVIFSEANRMQYAH